MPSTFTTSLAEDYQAGEWHIPEALREIVSNSLDGETRGRRSGIGKSTIKYDPGQQTLSVINENTVVELSSLLMGTSDSRGGSDTIGTFGEGLPMSLLVFAREGYAVKIESGWHSWVPYLDYIPRMPGIRVLHVRTRKLRQQRRDFSVVIQGISQSQYDALTNNFLSMRSLEEWFEDAFWAPTDSSSPKSVRRGLLPQPEMEGRVYIKGVYICTEPDLAFGYNLVMPTNRDRALVNRWELRSQISDLLEELLNSAGVDNDQLSLLLFESAVKNSRSIEANLDGNLNYCTSFVSFVQRRFVEKHGDDAYPALSTQDVTALSHVGLKGVIVPPIIHAVLSKLMGSTEEVIAKLVRDSREKIDLEDLTAEEKEVFDQVVHTALSVVAAEVVRSLSVFPCKFHPDSKLEGLFERIGNRQEIHINRERLGDFGRALGTMVHELAHFWGGDGRRAHHEAESKIWANIANSFFHQKYEMDLTKENK